VSGRIITGQNPPSAKPCAEAVVEKANYLQRPKLYYFDLYGRGEPIRMLLNHARVDFEDKRLSNAEFAELRENGTLPSGQVPLWEDEEGRQVN